MQYTLEQLIEKFAEHAKRLEIAEIQFQLDNPDLPNDDFNLPEGLKLICEELQKLKDKVK